MSRELIHQKSNRRIVKTSRVKAVTEYTLNVLGLRPKYEIVLTQIILVWGLWTHAPLFTGLGSTSVLKEYSGYIRNEGTKYIAKYIHRGFRPSTKPTHKPFCKTPFKSILNQFRSILYGWNCSLWCKNKTIRLLWFQPKDKQDHLA